MIFITGIETDAGIVFECSTLSHNREELIYEDATLKTLGSLKFLSPLLNLDMLWSHVENIDELRDFNDAFISNALGKFVDIFYPLYILNLHDLNVDTRMFLHKFFKIDGSTQGYPVFNVYCTNDAGMQYSNPVRFDWVKNTADDYIQLGALIECKSGGKKYTCSLISFNTQTYIMTEVSKFLYFGFKCVNISKRRGDLYPLPRVRYDMRGIQKTPEVVCDFVDSITEPVASTPTTMDSSSYYTKYYLERSKECFLIIPSGFILQDDWDTTENTELKRFREKAMDLYYLREYMESQSTSKNLLYTQVIGILFSNPKPTKPTKRDEDIIQEVHEIQR